jgi:phosphate transport system protein
VACLLAGCGTLWCVPGTLVRQLTEIEHRIEAGLGEAIATLSTVAKAVVDRVPSVTQVLIEAASELRRSSHGADRDLVGVAARHAPVAGDLRLLLALIQVAQHQGLVANQFELISEQLSGIEPGVEDRLRSGEKLARMAGLAGAQLQAASDAFAVRDLASALRIEPGDDAIDELNREILRTALRVEGGPWQRELACRHILIARSLERIGDNAVDIAEQAAFLQTGELRQFTDASKPTRRITASPS